MPTVLMRCPDTGKTMDLGIEVATDAWPSIQFENVQVVCSVCRQEHEVTKARTWLKGSDPFNRE